MKLDQVVHGLYRSVFKFRQVDSRDIDSKINSFKYYRFLYFMHIMNDTTLTNYGPLVYGMDGR